MNSKMRLFVFLVALGLPWGRTTARVFANKLADRKICADKDCSYALSLGTALDDFTSPDCRFINIRKGQMVYVYSKLTPAEGAGVSWSGSVYSERYIDQLGIMGYFPAIINETYVFKKDTVEIPTNNNDFHCE